MFTGTPRAPTQSDPELYQKYWPSESEESQADDDGLPARRQGLLQSLRVFCSHPGSPLEDLTPEEVLRARHALYLDWNALVGQDGPFPHHNPPQGHTAAEVLTCLALAAHEHLLQRCPPGADPSHVRLRLRSQRLHVRPHGLHPLTPMRSLKSDKIGKLVAVRCNPTHPGCNPTHPGCNPTHPGCNPSHPSSLATYAPGCNRIYPRCVAQSSASRRCARW